MRLFITLLTAIAILSACVSSEDYEKVIAQKKEAEVHAQQLESKKIELERKLKSALNELEEIKYGAAKLLTKAQAAHTEKNYRMSTDIANSLIRKHPDSPEASKAKQLITQNDKAIAARKAEEKRRIASAVKGLRRKYDEVQETYWYTPASDNGYKTSLCLYIGQKKAGGAPWLRFKLRFEDDSWAFIRSYIFKCDGSRYDYTPKNDIYRDNGSGSIWEVLDDPMDSQLKQITKNIIASKKTIVRFTANRYAKDFVVTSAMKRDMQKVLDAYKALGGVL